MKKPFNSKVIRAFSLIGVTILLTSMLAQTAAAGVVLFQDDNFQDVLSDALRIGSNDAGAVNTAIQFGNHPAASNNGNITWNIGTLRFALDHAVDVTGDITSSGLNSTGIVNLSGASQNLLRKSTSPNTLAACTTLGEVIVNTTTNRVEICTTTGIAGVAVWSAPTTTIASGASDPVVACTLGDLFYNTTTGVLRVCTAVTPVWSSAGPQDFESVYAKDADKILTTSNGNFTVAAGSGTTTLNEATLNSTSTAGTNLNAGAASTFTTSAGNLGLSATTGNVNVTGGAAAVNAVNINASNAAGGITGAWGTGGLNFASATGAFSITGTGASTVGATSGNLNLSTTTSGNVVVNSAKDVTVTSAGVANTNFITFKDPNLAAAIKFNNSQTALAAKYVTNGFTGVLDALNSITSTTGVGGASEVGTVGTFTNFTPATPDVQAALNAIDSKIGSAAPNNEDLTFSPEYPNTVIYRDNTPANTNNGTLQSDNDGLNNNYYSWATNKAALQHIDLKFRFPLPSDYVSAGLFTLNFRTGLGAATNNKVDVKVSNATNLTLGVPTVCGSSLANFSTTFATTATIAASVLNTSGGCNVGAGTALAAGKIVEVDVTLYANNTANAKADASYVNLQYNN